MSEPFMSEIRIMSFAFPPKGWALCNGQLLAINQNQALFALLGTTYGGDGRVNFALPNLQGRVPMHMGNSLVLGHAGGEATHTLSMSELPTHVHPANGSPNPASVISPTGNFLATSPGNVYVTNSGAMTPLQSAAITSAGGSQLHENMAPYSVLSFCIALQGIFPSQN